MKTRNLFAVTLALLALPHLLLAFAVSVPPLYIIGAVFLGLAVLAWRVDRWWAIVPGVVLSTVAALHTFAFYTAFTRFDSAAEFIAATSALSLGVVAVTLGISDLVGRKRHTVRVVSPVVVRAFGVGLAALVVVAAASAVVTVAGRDTVSAADREGALVIAYKNTDVVGDDPFTATAGEVRLVIDNKDVSFHNFVIKDAGVSVDVGPKESKLLVKELAPGTYTFKCTIAGHSAMTGTLVVE